MKLKGTWLAAVAVAIVMGSCSAPKKIEYVQDLDYGQLQSIQNSKEITVQPEDKLSIVVNSRDEDLARMFNLPVMTNRVGETSKSTSYLQNMSCYSVDSKGCIDFPVIGKVKVEGLTRMQIANDIQTKLRDKRLVNDAVVTVEFANLYISVLGEVKSPGRYSIDRDHVSIFDALGMAGDLTIYGRRDSVVVLRQVGEGQQIAYTMNLTSAKDLQSSPAYYLQQKDVVYVRPNNTRKRQSTANGNTLVSSSFWISVTSLIASICAIFIN
ncbi:MAG: polysaccharide biosynthesis/export family protein [Prevotella sp.]|jgi:polysaccharide export outer membrane protein